MKVKSAAFLIKDPANIWECTRSAAGLAVENILIHLFFIDVDLDISNGEADFFELLEMIDDLDGSSCTTRLDQTESVPFLTHCGPADIRNRLSGCDVVICF